MKPARTLASLLAVVGCAANPAFGLDLGTTSTANVTDGTTDLDMSSGTDVTTSTTSNGATTTGLIVTTTSDDTTADATTAEFLGPHSCGEARVMGMATSGLQKIATPAGTVEVWCEQEVADGGWMLVGRSAKEGTATGFGWGDDFGAAAQFDSPYSLDAITLALPMTQILIGVHEGGNRPVKTIYALTVPVDFLTAYPAVSAPISTTFTVAGSCSPPDGPDMLSYAGFTDLNDRFRLRDLAGLESDSYGLLADGFHTHYDNCHQGGDLNAQQGVMFVR